MDALDLLKGKQTVRWTRRREMVWKIVTHLQNESQYTI